MKITTPFLILLLTTTAGCVTRVETLEPPHPAGQRQTATPQRKTVVDKRVVIDPALTNIIRIVGIKSTMGAEGFLKIQVNVQSLVKSTKQFSYRIDWFDENGQELPMAASLPMPWTLLSQETSFLAATAPTPAARDFRVTFSGPGN
jgi:uncharacterized protein YcfL